MSVAWSAANTAEGTVRVRDVEATDPRAYAALWRFLLDTDLISRVVAPNRPVDDALFHLVSDVRHCAPTVLDSLYARVADAPIALTARSYAAPVDLVLDLDDALAPGTGAAGGSPATPPARCALVPTTPPTSPWTPAPSTRPTWAAPA